MPAAEFFKQLFDYNHHSNQHLIDVFDKHNFSPEKLIQLFSHVLNAHHIWNTRILLQPAEYTVWQLHLSLIHI